MIVLRERTAISRNKHSLPVKLAIQDQFINNSRSVFDYGCGKGDDLVFLKSQNISCSGWVKNVDL